ncbi:MAG: chorismate mutase [Planctomycetales bacterium]|jgi:chorismate mutase|nr:chorismate mutase [Planctomycetales bacterium]
MTSSYVFWESQFMAVRGVRGATTVEADDAALIHAAARELMEEILRRNQIADFDDVISAVFTTTVDLVSAFPAEAARAIGMNQVPLLCATEIPVAGAMPRCIRVLLHINSDRTPKEIEHVYLREAQKLRPDLKSAQ